MKKFRGDPRRKQNLRHSSGDLLLAKSHELGNKAFDLILKRCSLHEPLSAPEQDKNASTMTHHELFDTKLKKLAVHTNAP